MSEENKQITVYRDAPFEVTPFEESIKHLIEASEIKPGLPVAAAFGRQGLGDVPSFGGHTLAENSQRVDAALQSSYDLQRVWNRSHSNWLWRHVNLTYHSPHTNIRQLAAEIQSKRSTINSAKWNHLKSEIGLRRQEESFLKAKEENAFRDKYEEAEIMMSIAQAKESLADGMAYIEGCMKDILELTDLLNQMKEQHGDLTEADIEAEETKNHLRRSIVQCLRDVRMTGRISKGEQEYMEQIGVNPAKIEAKMLEYVEWEKSDAAPWDTRGLFGFVDELTDMLADKAKVGEIRMQLLGIQEKVNIENTYNEKVALKLTNKPQEE
jgi:hypothetical protein